MDLLFNGYDVDCTSEDFNSKATCSVFESGEVKAVFPKGEEEDMYLFALFGAVKLLAFLKQNEIDKTCYINRRMGPVLVDLSPTEV